MRVRLSALLLCAALMVACRDEPKNLMRVEIAVSGMVCDSCVQAITHEVGRLEGVQSVEVDLENGKAVVLYAEGVVEPAALEQTIDGLGYTATPGSPVAAEP
jgi:copper ion binding protein